jgi:methionyl-tRNA formyltransferase
MNIRLVFFGTPEFAVPSLLELNKQYQVVGVVTQPDRPSGRGKKLIPPAVKGAAENLSLEVFQPQNINNTQALDQIRSWTPDLICVAAFGQILSPDLLGVPRYGCLNVHASLLPRWRGASPVSAVILAGDRTTGVSIMKMSAGLDDGPVLSQTSLVINNNDTAGSLSEKLAELGAKLLVKIIPEYIQGELQPQPQDPSLASYAGILKKKDGILDFNLPADELVRKVRAFNPWPGTYTFWKDQRLIIHQCRSVTVTSPGQGVFKVYEGFPAVGTARGILVLEELQLAGKKKISGQEFLRGMPGWP